MMSRSNTAVEMKKFPLVALVLVCCCSFVAQGQDLCRRLQEMNGVNEDFMASVGYNFNGDGEYFCGPDAPAQFSCSCGTAGVCVEQRDPWGRNVGQCGCCPTWVWIVLAVFSTLLLSSAFMVIYACCLRGKWWFDGYPEPIQPLLPRRGPPAVVPLGMPLPQSLFRGYRIADFSSEPQQQPTTPEGAAQQSGDSQTGGDVLPLQSPPPPPSVVANPPSWGSGGSPTSMRSQQPVSRPGPVPMTSSTTRHRRPSEHPPRSGSSSQQQLSSAMPPQQPYPSQRQNGSHSSSDDGDGSSNGAGRHSHSRRHRNPNQPVTSTSSSRHNSDSSHQQQRHATGGTAAAHHYSMHVPTADTATDDRTVDANTPTLPSSPLQTQLRTARSTTTLGGAAAVPGAADSGSHSTSPQQGRRPESIDLSML